MEKEIMLEINKNNENIPIYVYVYLYVYRKIPVCMLDSFYAV